MGEGGGGEGGDRWPAEKKKEKKWKWNARETRDKGCNEATRIKEFHAFLFFFFRAALIYVEKNSGDERKE